MAVAPDDVSCVRGANLAGSPQHGVILKGEVVVAYPGWFVVPASPGTLVRRRKCRISSQFSSSTFTVVQRSHSRWSDSRPSATEVVNPTETASEYAASWMRLHQAMARGEEACGVVGEDVACLDSGSPEGGRWRLVDCPIVLPTGSLRDAYGEGDARARENRR